MNTSPSDSASQPRGQKPLLPGDPYCANCGYHLKGLTESPKCPECGRPLVEVLTRQRGAGSARRFRSETMVFGAPLVDIAFGPRPEFGESKGRARGVIALGDDAKGLIAVGGRATGVVAVGGMAMGGVTVGGMSIGAVSSLGGLAIGGMAVGGSGIGIIATGGGAVGFVARGGLAIGYYAYGGGAFGKHIVSPSHSDPQAEQMLTKVGWFTGGYRPWPSVWNGLAVHGAITAITLLIVLALAYMNKRNARSSP